jgi:hypothetical protein
MKIKRRKRVKSLRSSVIAGAVMVAVIALIVPAGALAAPVPVTIGGPTAADWVADGTTAGIGVTLVATPANELSHTYVGTGTDSIFDAPDRDTIGPAGGPFGLGVDNTKISNGMPGVTSQPSEIGYYGNAAICGDGMALADKCADQLAVELGKSLYGGSFEVTFFYGSEQSGETLKVELLRDGVEQDSSVYGPANTGEYSSTNPGRHEFTLPNVYWDEIRFIGDNANVADATDFLVESVSGYDRPELGGATATGSGTRIPSKGGNWFMYNTYPEVGGDNCFDLQAGNPKDGINIVGEYCIVNNGGGMYTATYDIDDTITVGGFEYDIVVLNEHLAINTNTNTNTFTGSPGTDDNKDFGVPFLDTDGDGKFKVFAHFAIDYV